MAYDDVFTTQLDKNGKLIRAQETIRLLSYAFPFPSGIRVTGEIKWRLAKEFGYSKDRWHTGIDCVSTKGEKSVQATMEGTVVSAGLNRIVPAMGFTVVINHSKDTYQSIYAHLASVKVKAGDHVTQGQVIGVMGGTGVSGAVKYSPHLHYQVMKSQGSTQIAVDSYQNPTNVINPCCLLWPKDPSRWGKSFKSNMVPDNIAAYAAAQGLEYTTDGDLISGEENTLNISAGGEKLLSPSNDERKYGVSVYDTVQPLIRSSTAAGINAADQATSSSANEAIRSYAKYLYYYLNSMVTRANVNCISMPWIRPGFNVWVDPLNIDEVYYVDSVSHNGSPSGGVYTSIGLTFGRDRLRFASDGYKFGSLKNKDSDNVFVNSIDIGVNAFGETLDSKSDFENVKKEIEKYYSQESHDANKADSDSLLTYLYGE